MRERLLGGVAGLVLTGLILGLARLPLGWVLALAVSLLTGWAAGGMVRRLKRAAERDPLTGMSNRIPFERALREEFARAARYGRPLSLLFMEVDDFGRVNKSYGHLMGDQALKAVAEQMRHSIRSTDLLARWGGDEFVLLLPETGQDQAYVLAERIRRLVAECLVKDMNAQVSVTVSTGVASLAPGMTKPADMLRAAIEAQRKAKQRKNVVEFAV